jgi:hypothetical protein
VADINAATRAFDRYHLNKDRLIPAAEYQQVMAVPGDFRTTGASAQAVIQRVGRRRGRPLPWDEFWTELQG